jgi:hypothetical protein
MAEPVQPWIDAREGLRHPQRCATGVGTTPKSVRTHVIGQLAASPEATRGVPMAAT